MSGRAWTRNAIALIVVVVWLGVPAVAGVAAVLGRIQIAFLTQDLLPVWHDYLRQWPLSYLASISATHHLAASRLHPMTARPADEAGSNHPAGPSGWRMMLGMA